ncbi:zinc finger BED domain-containing protein 4 [Drosophila busckii]|uniref:zinc finger BED domain-containing protein 4 n=1 Tax=Drosophila busckii TaxID=30019 RepID=UPI001432D5C1|nr:zinc finger BED domain-containing protein 4 [Drosophila busckii]
MARSKIWKYYDKIDQSTAQCQLCEKIIKTCGNTSNLMKHMKTHPQIDVNDNESVVVRGILKREPNLSKHRNRKMRVERGYAVKIEKLVKAETDTDAVNIIEFVDGDAEAHAAVESVVAEETYTNWLGQETESAETVSAGDIIEFEPKHGQYQTAQSVVSYHINGEQEAENENADCQLPRSPRVRYMDRLAYFVCRDKHPLHIIKGEGFQELIGSQNAELQLPSIEQLGNYINLKAQKQVAHLRRQFNQMETLSLSCSLSTTAEFSYLELAAHYYEGINRRSRTLAVDVLPNECYVGSIVGSLERACQQFDIDKSKIVCIVCRDNQLLKEAVTDMLGRQGYMPCFAQQLESLLECVLQRFEFTALCEKVRHFIMTSDLCTELKLPLDVRDRALSSYDMLERYLKLQHKMQLNALAADELDLASELLAVLTPIISAVRQLCGNSVRSYPYASNVLPILFTILNELKQPLVGRSRPHQFVHELRTFVIRKLEESYNSFEQNPHMAFASLLDPRFRNMPFQSVPLMTKYMTQLYTLYEERGEAAAAEMAAKQASTEGYNIWSAYSALAHEKYKQSTMTTENESEDEISSFFNANSSCLQTEPLLLWQNLAQFHPFLQSLAMKYLHIPASALPPARLFTDEGSETSDCLAKLEENHMNNMVIMSDCNKEEWNL